MHDKLRIKEAVVTRHRFPDGTWGGEAINILCERGEHEVWKKAQVSGCARAVSTDPTHHAEWMYQIHRCIKEADMDIAYLEHGADWRTHREYEDAQGVADIEGLSLIPPLINQVGEIQQAREQRH